MVSASSSLQLGSAQSEENAPFALFPVAGRGLEDLVGFRHFLGLL